MRMAFVKQMQAKGCDPTRPYLKPRDIEVNYRGVNIRVLSQSPVDSFNIRVACRVRGLAVDEGVLAPLWCENDLVKQPRPPATVTVDPAVLSECMHFRESAHGLLSVVEATGPNIEDLIKRKGSFFQGIDRSCRVELSFWSSSLGEKARERVHAAIQECLPQPGRPKSLAVSLGELDELQDSKIMVFAGAALQSTFKVVQGFVKALKLGTSPALEKAGDSPFMTVVKERLGLFFLRPAVGAPASSTAAAVVKTPQVAAAEEWAKLKDTWDGNREAVEYAAVARLQAYQFLLEKAVQDDLRKIGAAIVAMKSEAGPASTNPKKPKKGAAAGASAQSAVAALFAK